MPETFDEVIADIFTVKNDNIPQTAWPRLTCGVANEVTFVESSLKLGDQREIFFQNSGQLRVVADLRILTGAPSQTEKLRILNNGNVGIGTAAPEGKLDVRGDIRAGNSDLYFTKTDHNHTGIGNATGFAAIENAANYNALMILGRAGAPQGRAVKIWDYLEVNGPLDVRGDLSFPNTGGGSARLSNQTFSNESSFQNNNVKLIMGSTSFASFPGPPPLVYEFAVGQLSSFFQLNPFRIVTSFIKRFSINQNGDAYFAGGKTGYVVDHFVNRVGDVLEQGDVVVISKYESSIYSGTDNNIPLPEVDLAEAAYDTRVCGVVAKAVAENDLPFVEVPTGDQSLPMGQPIPESKIAEAEKGLPYEHPLKPFAAPAGDRKQVQDQQMGTMVTLGAYAHCKVDADIAPVEVGDLLTTSPTKGHAQKALDPSKAVGAIIGKALSSLKKGRGKIPVLVMLQ